MVSVIYPDVAKNLPENFYAGVTKPHRSIHADEVAKAEGIRLGERAGH
ncbi:hypothetical protein PthstB1num2_00270 [Parageobacillus thermoglucosidasius]|nr:hypothetical protein PthstB1num2_00270 [Parageobacillus thermoglucosidasius]